MRAIYGCGSIFFWRRCDMLYASGGYMDDAMFAHNDQEYSIRRGRILKVIQKGAARI